MIWKLTSHKILLITATWAGLFLLLSATQFNHFQILNIVGFLTLTLLPGLLTVILLKLDGLPFWAYLSLSVAFSLLELMVMALLGNAALPYFGVVRPLDGPYLLVEFFILISVLVAVSYKFFEEVRIPIKRFVIFKTWRDVAFALTPIVFVLMSIAGAMRLNNGATGTLTLVMLGAMGVYIAGLIYYSEKLGENVIPVALFFLSLALLLMTSLRGWYVTGHDIQSEYKVFELTKNAGLWSMAFYRDVYNACLSITILPTTYFNLLKVPDPYVYKIFFQILFALCPGIVYLIARHWTNRWISLLATIYFISFPTFFGDMPFLIRQEIAFIFYGLMLYIIITPKIGITIRQVLFVIMGIGIILSHYSTTYTILVIFGLSVVSRPIFILLINRFKNKAIFRRSALIPPLNVEALNKAKITFYMVAILFVASFLWTSTITDTGGGLQKVIKETISAVRDGFAGNNRSIDAISLLSFSKPNQNQELKDYISYVVAPIRKVAPSGEYFEEQTYSKYIFTALEDVINPISRIGRIFERLGIDVRMLMLTLGQILSKLIEILMPLGMVYFLFRKSIVKNIDNEIYLISFYYLIFIILNIILPVLSTEYGIYRALQQSMFIIAPVIVVGGTMIGIGLMQIVNYCTTFVGKNRVPIKILNNVGKGFTIVLAMLFFLYSTSLIRQILGGNISTLHLNNAGRYYDNYLIRLEEIYGVEWLTNTVAVDPESAQGIRLLVQADRYSNSKFASLTSFSAQTDIFPGLIRKKGYVFIGPSVTKKQRATIIYNSDQVVYTYPIKFLDDNKNLIYDNGGVDIYK